jgi:hypothetical protein
LGIVLNNFRNYYIYKKKILVNIIMSRAAGVNYGKNANHAAGSMAVWGIMGGGIGRGYSNTSYIARRTQRGFNTTTNFLLWAKMGKNTTGINSRTVIDGNVKRQADLMKMNRWWSFNPQASGGVGHQGKILSNGNRAGYVK